MIIMRKNKYSLCSTLPDWQGAFFMQKEGEPKMATGNKAVGRPPKYKTAKEMQDKIEEYFEWCKGKFLKSDSDMFVLDKSGYPVIVDSHPPTVTGLALALGFNTRQALLNYQGKQEFVDTITRAKARVEQYAEERLFDRDGANGAKFSLANNFRGWSEKQQIEADVNKSININIELSDEE